MTASDEWRAVSKVKDWDVIDDPDALSTVDEKIAEIDKILNEHKEVVEYPRDAKGKPIPPPPSVTTSGSIRKRLRRKKKR